MISEKTVKMAVMRLTVCIILKHLFFHFHSSAPFSALLFACFLCLRRQLFDSNGPFFSLSDDSMILNTPNGLMCKQ